MIGVFDSGIGGLTVLTAIHRLLPGESLVYFADQAYSPYGSLDSQTLIKRCERIIQYLIEQGASIVVIACNTATAVAIDQMRTQFTVPIVGVEPGIKPAALNSQTRRIGILATENTVASTRYEALMQRFIPQVNIYSQPCAGLADAIENDHPETLALLNQYLQPLLAADIDHLVLGCTHYPLLTPHLTRQLHDRVTLVDTSEAVAQEVARRLPKPCLASQTQQVQLQTNSSVAMFSQVLKAYDSLCWLCSADIQQVTL